MKIESLQNKKVKEWVKRKEKKYRDETNSFLIEGDHLLREAKEKGIILEILSNDPSFALEGIPFYEVTEEILKKISNQKSGTNVIALCQKMQEKTIAGKVCILDNIQDPGNLGTIIRSAFAFQIETIILSEDTVDLYNDKVIRASEGMIFHLNFIRGNLQNYCTKLKDAGYDIYGTDVAQGQTLKSTKFSEKSAIIIGNEGKGMNPLWQKECRKILHIPINQYCESLNVGVAASIIFYEMQESRANEYE